MEFKKEMDLGYAGGFASQSMRNRLNLFISIPGTVSADTHVRAVTTAIAGHLIAGFDLSTAGALEPPNIELVEYWLIRGLLHSFSNLQLP